SQKRRLLDDLESGRTFYGIDALLPAFYRKLDTVFDYLPADARLVVYDPSGCARAVREELSTARGDRGAAIAEGRPTFELDALYIDEGDLAELLTERGAAVVHRVPILGEAPPEDAEPLDALEATTQSTRCHLGGEDQSLLESELRARRATSGQDDTLLPVATRARAFLDSGFRVYFAARTHSQAERLVHLLRGYEVP